MFSLYYVRYTVIPSILIITVFIAYIRNCAYFNSTAKSTEHTSSIADN